MKFLAGIYVCCVISDGLHNEESPVVLSCCVFSETKYHSSTETAMWFYE